MYQDQAVDKGINRRRSEHNIDTAAWPKIMLEIFLAAQTRFRAFTESL
jgi:hypothetical protein